MNKTNKFQGLIYEDMKEKIDTLGRKLSEAGEAFDLMSRFYGEQVKTNPKKCEHESDGLALLSHPPQYQCKKCGEFYR